MHVPHLTIVYHPNGNNFFNPVDRVAQSVSIQFDRVLSQDHNFPDTLGFPH